MEQIQQQIAEMGRELARRIDALEQGTGGLHGQHQQQHAEVVALRQMVQALPGHVGMMDHNPRER